MPAAQTKRLRGCAQRFRLLAEEDPQLELLAKEGRQWRVKKLDKESYDRLYGAVDLSSIPFGTRTLLEGLIGHGILKPGDAGRLMNAIQGYSASPKYHEKMLESLYGEERIRNIEAIVRSGLPDAANCKLMGCRQGPSADG